MLLTANFWKDCLERAVRTFAQVALAGFGGSSLNIWTASWHQVTGLALGAALLSILMTIDRSGSSVSHPVFVAPSAPPPVEPSVPMVTCGDKPN